MVNYEELVKNYFKGKNIGLTLKEVGKRLNVPYEDMDDLATAIYLLEVNGYLYKIDDTYFRCPKDFIYKTGTIENLQRVIIIFLFQKEKKYYSMQKK